MTARAEDNQTFLSTLCFRDEVAFRLSGKAKNITSVYRVVKTHTSLLNIQGTVQNESFLCHAIWQSVRTFPLLCAATGWSFRCYPNSLKKTPKFLTARRSTTSHLSFRGQLPGRCTGLGDPTAWSPRSPDVTRLDFYLWVRVKDLVYVPSLPQTQDDLKDRMQRTAARTDRQMLQNGSAETQSNKWSLRWTFVSRLKIGPVAILNSVTVKFFA
jgi:hypothetical protein